MTSTVKKGANRAAHTAKTNRHAQRTPLPPRKGDVEAAREPIARIISEEDRERLDSRLVDGAHPRRAAKSAKSNGDDQDPRSQTKAHAFAEKAVAAKWQVSTAVVAGAVEVTATRGAETIVQAWRNGVWDYTVSFYAYGDRNTKPRNASGAARLLTRTPAEAAGEASKVASNKHFRKAEPKDISVRLEDARKALPFDPALATDEEVCAALSGRALSWYNRLSRGTESAIVGRKGVRITVLDDGQRVANFCCPATGYRSCLVTAILKVGRGRNATTKGDQTASVEVE